MTEFFVRLGEETLTLGTAGPITIGRNESADIHLDHPLLSGEHLVLTGAGDQWSGCDLGTGTGTYVDGKPVQVGTFLPLDPGMQLLLGDPVDSVPLTVLGTERQAPRRGMDAPEVDVLQVGRAADNDLVLKDSSVSSHHALVEKFGPGQLRVHDLGSTNGTYVDGVAVHTQDVTEGSIVSFGRSFFRVGAEGLVPIDERSTGPVTEAPSLSFTQVSYQVTNKVRGRRKSKTLLDEVSFTVPPRSLLAVIGPSGAGKTTLLNTITGAIKPSGGQVVFNRLDMAVFAKSLRGRVGLVPQEDLVHRQLTARQALKYAAALRFSDDVSRAERDQAVTWALSELGLSEQADLRVRNLSGGQRKRVSTAMELLTKPDLLLLDEPTSGLDPNLDREIMALLADLAHGNEHSPEGRTVVVVTHSTDNLDQADNVLLLAPGGKVAFFGPPQELNTYFGQDQSGASWAAIYSRLNADPDGVQAEFATSRFAQPLPEPVPAIRPWRGPRARKRHFLPQVLALVRRQSRLMAADGYLMLFTFALPIAVALLTLVVQAKDGFLPSAVIDDVGQPKSLLVILTFGSVLMGLVPSVRQLVVERVIFVHEAWTGVRPGAYLSAKVILLGLVSAVQSALLITVILYLNPHAEQGIFTNLWTELFLSSFATAWTCAVCGLLLSSLVRTVEQVMPLMVVVLMLQLVLGGGVLPVTNPGINELSMLTPGRWGLAAGAASLDFNSVVLCHAEVLGKQTEDREVNKKAVEATNDANKRAADRAKDLGLPKPKPQKVELRHTVVDCTKVKGVDPLWDHTMTAWGRDMGALGGWFLLAAVCTGQALRRRVR